MEDERIVELFWNRDERAVSQMQEKYGRYCREISRRILKNNEDVQECLNDTWYRIWESIPPQRPRFLKAYAAKIIRNLSLDRLVFCSAQRRNPGLEVVLDELEECIPSGLDVEEAFAGKELAEKLNIFLGSLEQEKRCIFLRRYWYSDSIDDIARRYGFSRTKVKSILFRVRKKLREYLEAEEVM